MIRNLLLAALMMVVGIRFACASELFKQIVQQRAERIDVMQRAIPARLGPMRPIIEQPPDTIDPEAE